MGDHSRRYFKFIIQSVEAFKSGLGMTEHRPTDFFKAFG